MLSLEEGAVKNTNHPRLRHLGQRSDPDGEWARPGFMTEEPGGGDGDKRTDFNGIIEAAGTYSQKPHSWTPV